ncbi:polysaccharide deacetylase family protein [Seonamhaeicola marinus]|uniref:Polysaccharide deacetylase family protein n=1 Tax=Seonamhaeicola marinus TaxID=1912246 RepID=A0A5D0HEU1_9FLAO|nr:polysaccharide deacetylase family protein [Seonamhaeicola marinus]TYA69835.1 polysaccharide deacetylase family protein [Seonamhaeicola marinus]
MGLVKDILYKASKRSFLRKVNKQNVFPYYHIIEDHTLDHIKNLYSYKNKAQFSYDIDVLKQHYKPITPQDLLSGNYGDNCFLLSFDDGLKEIYTNIYPILKEKGVKGVFFINPQFVDNKEGLYKHYASIILSHIDREGLSKEQLEKVCSVFGFNCNTLERFKLELKGIPFSEREKLQSVFEILNLDIKDYLEKEEPYITRSQIKEMIDDGFYFGGHTMSHPPLHQLSFEEQKNEIIASMEWLKVHFGIDYSLFSFPFSDRSISKKLIEALFEYDSNIIIFGNSGLKQDIDDRIIQRFNLEKPDKQVEKQIVTENLYKYYNKIIGKYKINRS